MFAGPVEHVGVGAQGVRVALDLRGVEESVDRGPDGRSTGRAGGGCAPPGLQCRDGRRHRRTPCPDRPTG
ncbi:hypothetical protein H4W33_000073 [Kibdelosporangium phytohabitans]|nr:hypothetical protein [Kibdelosporangium phytohabitans]